MNKHNLWKLSTPQLRTLLASPDATCDVLAYALYELESRDRAVQMVRELPTITIGAHGIECHCLACSQ